MLVKRIKATDGRAVNDESGSTLIVVLIVMLVLAVGSTALAGIIVNTTGSLAGSRDRAQAQAAVDAGIAAQTARLESGDLACAAKTETDVLVNDASGPRYDFTLACGGGAATLTVTSTVSGATAKRETVFSYQVTPAPSLAEPALVTRSPLNLAALTIKSVNPAVPATVWVIPEVGVSGDFTCNSGGAIAGSVYLPAGTVFGAGGCEVKGDVYAEGNITIGSGTTIRGDLVSLNGSVTITGGNTIDGSIYAKKNVTGSGLSGKFVTSIHAGADLNLAGGAPVARDRITYGGTFTRAHSSESAWAVNSVTKAVVNPPTLPTAPTWRGITQTDLDALVTSGTFAKVNWTGACSSAWNHPMQSIIEGFTVPTMIVTTCSRLPLPIEWSALKLKTDVVFVAPSFNLVGQKFSSADGNEHKVWFISPEQAGRNCAAVPAINVQGVQMLPVGSSKISGMIFSQCTVSFANSGEDWQGSIHAGTMAGKPNFWYKPIGFPGETLPGGGGPSTPGNGSPTVHGLTVVSNRDLS